MKPLLRNDLLVSKALRAELRFWTLSNSMREMIPHHQGAIRMAENALKYDICTELVPILRSIITQQRQGVAQMRNQLSRMGCRRA